VVEYFKLRDIFADNVTEIGEDDRSEMKVQ